MAHIRYVDVNMGAARLPRGGTMSAPDRRPGERAALEYSARLRAIRQGRARRFVLGLLFLLTVAGCLGLLYVLVALVALATGAPLR